MASSSIPAAAPGTLRPLAAPDELLVKWQGGGKSPATRRAEEALLASLGASVSAALPALDMARLRVSQTGLDEALARL